MFNKYNLHLAKGWLTRCTGTLELNGLKPKGSYYDEIHKEHSLLFATQEQTMKAWEILERQYGNMNPAYLKPIFPVRTK